MTGHQPAFGRSFLFCFASTVDSAVASRRERRRLRLRHAVDIEITSFCTLLRFPLFCLLLSSFSFVFRALMCAWYTTEVFPAICCLCFDCFTFTVVISIFRWNWFVFICNNYFNYLAKQRKTLACINVNGNVLLSMYVCVRREQDVPYWTVLNIY